MRPKDCKSVMTRIEGDGRWGWGGGGLNGFENVGRETKPLSKESNTCAEIRRKTTEAIKVWEAKF